ncbi:MAG: PIG-L family deacetylase [Anaerolineae bacterium]|nr:PIG-L family deacetylase [Anaerolineae bacterium]MCI0610514.1 PIG-L family deacetylase [Anaerolineae bacterium]
MTEQTDHWETPQKILVILAHPDDPEFFCGGTLAQWARAGHEITYVLLTCGDKGFNPATHANMTPETLCGIRYEEQQNAAKVIGAKSVHFLDRADGYLTPDLDLRRDVVRAIRQHKPDILVTCDPQTLFAPYGINHPDHRAAGQVVLDAVFPAAGNLAFFPELIAEGYPPHMPKEVWCSLTTQANTTIDVTKTWQIKLDAILQHKSQIADVEKFLERMKSRHTEDSTDENPRYEEKFRVVKYK